MILQTNILYFAFDILKLDVKLTCNNFVKFNLNKILLSAVYQNQKPQHILHSTSKVRYF